MKRSEPGALGAKLKRIATYIDNLHQRWNSSLVVRVMAIIVAAGVAGILIMGFAISAQVRISVFNQTVDSNVEQFSTDVSLAQERFSVSSANMGQTQEVANSLVASMYDPVRGTLGAVLLRAPGQENSAMQIFEPATASATRVRSLVTADLRNMVTKGEKIGWQSVEIPADASSVPGIVIGTTLEIPGAGKYELYAAYSMENQQNLIKTIIRVMWLSVLAFLFILGVVTWAVMRWVLAPVREASRNAHQLAEGEFQTRMQVRGTDEIAQLASSFNSMAESLEHQFTQMERMSRVQTEFVSAVSHELRSPVTTVRMAGQLIYDKRDELPPLLRRSAELQHTQLISLDATLADLLEISRYDAGGMTLATEEADVAALVKEVIEISEPLAQANGVSVRFTASGDTTADIEPRRIQRLARNLLVNALEHAEGNPVNVTVAANDSAVAVMVQDNGVGLNEEQIEHVFDRFWRADASRVRKSGGTGLGLTIAREDARIHGGTLEVAGELGVGATFLLTLPKIPHDTFSPPIQLAAPTPLAEEEKTIPADSVAALEEDPDAAVELRLDEQNAGGEL